MYNPYLAFVDKYFPNAVPVVDSFHVTQWIVRAIDNYIRQLIKKYRWLILSNQANINYHTDPRMDNHFHCLIT